MYKYVPKTVEGHKLSTYRSSPTSFILAHEGHSCGLSKIVPLNLDVGNHPVVDLGLSLTLPY